MSRFFLVTVSQTTSIEVEVEAETEDEAGELVLQGADFEDVDPNEPYVSSIVLATDDEDASTAAGIAAATDLPQPSPERGQGGPIPNYPPTLTVGQIVLYLQQFPDDMAVTVATPDGANWYNITSLTNPREYEEMSIIIETADDFNSRQW